MGSFLSVARDMKLLCNYQDASVAEFETRFRRYRSLDFAMVVLFMVTFVLPVCTLVLTNSLSLEFGGAITGNKNVDAALPLGMALLFLADGILMIFLMRHITAWQSSSHSASSLRKEIMVNVATNSLTFIAYVAWRFLILLKSEKALSELAGDLSGIIFVVIYLGMMLLKLTKIFVMAAFARYLNTRGDSSTLPLCTNPMAEVIAHPSVAPSASAKSLSQEAGHV